MKEDFLHYVWKFQKFNTRGLQTTSGEDVIIKKVGQHNKNAGPDFFNARLFIADQDWAGNVEIHKNSSDWYAHQHESDSAYDNVILHVVWNYDAEVYRKDNLPIPTLQLKDLVSPEVVSSYQELLNGEYKWINCENEFPLVDEVLIDNWLERLYFEKLEEKSKIILKELHQTQNHWEALLFRMLARNFGLKVNAESFFSMAKSLDFSIIQKCQNSWTDLETLFFGQCGMLEKKQEDGYYQSLQRNYEFFKNKFQLDNSSVVPASFFRLRPRNFPTIRLSQLAVLLNNHPNLFSKIIETNHIDDFYELFKISASEYWDEHYNFAISSGKRSKKLSKRFVDLLLINTVIPIKFCYASYLGKDAAEEVLQLISNIKDEDNGVIKRFKKMKPEIKTAMQSQALLQLKNEYCDKNLCLNCAVGNTVLNS